VAAVDIAGSMDNAAGAPTRDRIKAVAADLYVVRGYEGFSFGDIAQAVAFLADPEKSAFVNGHSLSVDGGWASDGSWDALRLSHR